MFKTKKALAGALLSLSLAGGIIAPVSVAFANVETTPVAPVATEAPVTETASATEVAVTEATAKYGIYIGHLDVKTGMSVGPGINYPSLPAGIYTYKPAIVEGWKYAGYYTINDQRFYGDVATVDPSKSADRFGTIGVDFYYEEVTTIPPTTEKPVPPTTEKPTPPRVEEPKVATPVYSLYQPDLKVHLYTKDTNEYKVLATRGWKQEGISWRTETQKGDAVYRLYHPGLRVHLYTKDANEYKVLATRGWKQEGVAYRSFGRVPVYRLYHPGLRVHLYTKDANEYKVLATRGWKQEGVAWHSQP